MTVFIQLAYNGATIAEMAPGPAGSPPTFILWGDFLPGGGQNCSMRERFEVMSLFQSHNAIQSTFTS